MPKQELLDAVWPGVFVGDAVLKVTIREIRKALGDDTDQPRFIETAHRRGYRFVAPVTPIAPPRTSRRGRAGGAERRRACSTRTAAASTSPTRSSDRARSISSSSWAGSRTSSTSGTSRRSRGSSTRLASFGRLILFDKRGTGLSDPVPVSQLPTLEQRLDDVRAVMEAAGSTRAVLLGVSEGGPLCSLFAATYPEKTEALVMIGSYARRLRDADYPWGQTPDERDAFCDDDPRAMGRPGRHRGARAQSWPTIPRSATGGRRTCAWARAPAPPSR